MEKRYYNAESLEHVLRLLERRYAMSSEAFYAAHLADEPLPELRGFDRHTWASFYSEHRRLSGAFSEQAEHVLA